MNGYFWIRSWNGSLGCKTGQRDPFLRKKTTLNNISFFSFRTKNDMSFYTLRAAIVRRKRHVILHLGKNNMSFGEELPFDPKKWHIVSIDQNFQQKKKKLFLKNFQNFLEFKKKAILAFSFGKFSFSFWHFLEIS